MPVCDEQDHPCGRPYYIRLCFYWNVACCLITPLVQDLFLVCSASSTDGMAEPPGASIESGNEIEPCPDFAKKGIAGGHSKKEEAGDGRELHQVMSTPVPAEAPCACTAIVPYDETGKYEQC